VKFFSLWVLCWVCLAVQAKEALLIPVFRPAPEFPKDLLKKRHAGKVFVNLTVGAFGTVQTARVRESSHPRFTEAAQKAVVQWRYEPWDVTDGRPSSVDITVPIIFGAQGIEPFSPLITVGLENTLCAYLNYEVQTSQQNFPDEPLSTVDVFWHAREHLAGSYTRFMVPDEDARNVLLSRLETAIPKAVNACRNNPQRKLSKFLPEEITTLWAGPG
jgi:TonB family protein